MPIKQNLVLIFIWLFFGIFSLLFGWLGVLPVFIHKGGVLEHLNQCFMVD